MTLSFILERCKTKAGYSAQLHSSRKLNLDKIKQHFVVVLATPILLVIQEQGLEIVVHGYGELLFKNGAAGQEELMKKVAEQVYEVGLGNDSL